MKLIEFLVGMAGGGLFLLFYWIDVRVFVVLTGVFFARLMWDLLKSGAIQ